MFPILPIHSVIMFTILIFHDSDEPEKKKERKKERRKKRTRNTHCPICVPLWILVPLLFPTSFFGEWGLGGRGASSQILAENSSAISGWEAVLLFSSGFNVICFFLLLGFYSNVFGPFALCEWVSELRFPFKTTHRDWKTALAGITSCNSG